MRPGDVKRSKKIEADLLSFAKTIALPGIRSKAARDCFIEQLIDSIRRIEYVHLIRTKNISPACADATNDVFDPLKAASWHRQQGNVDEAFWLAFLSIHFGKHKTTGWNLVRGVYGGLASPVMWDWHSVSTHPQQFRQWLHSNKQSLQAYGKFGNHRKYESLNDTGTGNTIASYISWVGPGHDHISMINAIRGSSGATNRRDLFNALYTSMRSVKRFGRMGIFDYLTMVGKLGLVDIEPDSPYMHGATGPYPGACLLFTGSKNTSVSRGKLETDLNALENHLGIYFGMQVLEDALCNWQKSPSQYIYFGG